MAATDGLTRGMAVEDTGAPITIPVGKETLGRILNIVGEPVDKGPAIKTTKTLPDPPAGPALRGPVDEGRDVRDRHQGRRPAGAVHEGRQDGPLRRRRRRQDRAHPGADQQHRQAARRHLGLRRGGGAHARGQRPLPRDEGVGRHREDGADLRPDDRAARLASAGRRSPALTAAEYFRDEEGQDVLLFIDNIFRFTQAGSEVSALLGPDALGRRLPADTGHRDGPAAGANHVDQEGLDHLGAGDLRARRRHHRPGAGHRLRAPRRHHRALAADRRARHLPGRRSRWRRPRASSTPTSSAPSTTPRRARCS